MLRAEPGPRGCLIAAHVLPPLPPGILGVETLNEFEAERRAAGQKLVDGLVEDAGVDTETRLLDGAPAEALAELAREVDAEDIVVGARGMGPLRGGARSVSHDEIVIGSRGFGRIRGVLGSVSHAVLREADRPVVVIPADAASGSDEPA